jgi:hypothetical protein
LVFLQNNEQGCFVDKNMTKGFFRITGCPQRIEFACALIELYLAKGLVLTMQLKGRIPGYDLKSLKPAFTPSILNITGRYTFRFTWDFYHNSKLIIYRYLPYDFILRHGGRFLADLRLFDYNPRVMYAGEEEKQDIIKLFNTLRYNKVITGWTDSN